MEPIKRIQEQENQENQPGQMMEKHLITAISMPSSRIEKYNTGDTKASH